MWGGLAFSGLIVTFFGIAVIFIYAPLGLVLIVAGPVMFVAGLVATEPQPITPEDPTKKFCTVCLSEIDLEAEVCPVCEFPQPSERRFGGSRR